MGVWESSCRKSLTIPRVPFKVAPDFKARWLAACIAGPSAMGSEKGMPSSIMSAPAAGSRLRRSLDMDGVGSPAVKKVMSPPRESLAIWANFRVSLVSTPMPLTVPLPMRGR